MSKKEAVIVLENLLLDFRVCRTEREALKLAIDSLTEEENETEQSE